LLGPKGCLEQCPAVKPDTVVAGIPQYSQKNFAIVFSIKFCLLYKVFGFPFIFKDKKYSEIQ